jgi:thioredoxin family protein
MAVTKERFAQGLTYDAFKAQMTQNKEKFEENERTVQLPSGALDAFRKAPKMHVLVLTEDWCGDALANVPILGRLAKETGQFDLRVFLRDQNDDLTAQFMNGEFKSIPVFAFFDESFREVGRWIERPASVTARRAKRRAEVFAADPRFGSPDSPVDQLPEAVRADLMAALQKMRDEMRPFADGEVIREVRELVTKAR